MANVDLTKYGITGATEIVYNPSFETLFEEETKADLTGYDKGQVTELGAVNVMTGVYTGRSPKDKFIVMDENSKDTVWWTTPEYPNDNHPASKEAWDACKKLAVEEDNEFGIILRAKGIIPDKDNNWLEFDLVPGEYEIRDGKPDYTGKLCVIGSELKEDMLKELFKLA